MLRRVAVAFISLGLSIAIAPVLGGWEMLGSSGLAAVPGDVSAPSPRPSSSRNELIRATDDVVLQSFAIDKDRHELAGGTVVRVSSSILDGRADGADRRHRPRYQVAVALQVTFRDTSGAELGSTTLIGEQDLTAGPSGGRFTDVGISLDGRVPGDVRLGRAIKLTGKVRVELRTLAGDPPTVTGRIEEDDIRVHCPEVRSDEFLCDQTRMRATRHGYL